jgi:regulator of protease activity HflC (stomatin/prohibitin superfamily)
MIIKQYERAIILRLGKYTRGRSAPASDEDTIRRHHILVVDIREKVREFKAERICLPRITITCR